DFERVVFPEYPELSEGRRALLRAGAKYASLSGSGSTLYGLFSSREVAARATARLRKQGWAARATAMLTRRAYWRRIAAGEGPPRGGWERAGFVPLGRLPSASVDGGGVRCRHASGAGCGRR